MGRRGGRRTPRAPRPDIDGPVRTCLGTRQRFAKGDLVRLVRAPDGRVLVDRWQTVPGRGAYVSYDRQAIEQVVRRKAFGRAFKASVVPIDGDALARDIVEAIEARIFDTLALARRRGCAVSGTDALLRALPRGEVRILIVAVDTAADTVRKLRARANEGGVSIVRYGLRTELGRSQGRDDRIAVGVLDAAVAERLTQEFSRRNRVVVAGDEDSL